MLTIESLYIHRLGHLRPTRTSDGQGGWTIGYDTLSDVVGRLRPAGASEKRVADQERAEVTHVLYCAATEDVEREDLLSLGSVVVEVIAVREPSHMDHHLEVDCVQVQKAPEEVGS